MSDVIDQALAELDTIPEHLKAAYEEMAKAVLSGDRTYIDALNDSLYDEVPVGIRQFIEDKNYLGTTACDLHENWKSCLEEVFDPRNPIVTLIMTGSIGCGKTSAAMVANCYLAYRLCCLREPQRVYNMLPSSKIVISIFNVTLGKADNGYNLAKAHIDQSPWFLNNCPRKKRPDEPIFFPSKNVFIEMGSLTTHALGENIFGFSMDEVDFFQKTQDPANATRAHSLFKNARTRIYSRFVQHGGRIPGLCILMSSRQTEAHFLEQLMEEINQDPKLLATTKVVSFSLWECKPAKDYCGKTFDVLVGDDTMASRVLEPDELAPEGYQVISVPVEFEQSFALDVDDSIRDIAGISTAGSFAFFPDKVKLAECIDKTRVNPFRVPEITTLTLGSGNRMQDYLNTANLYRIVRSVPMPRFHPDAKRHIHIDLGLTGEAAGFCMAHPVYYPDGSIGMCVDMMTRILGTRGKEVDLTAIVEFVTYLRQKGFGIEHVTYDNFQSRHSIQLLTTSRIVAGIQSVGADAYNVLKGMIMTGKVSMPDHPHLMKELREIRKGDLGGLATHNLKVTKDRPRHPPGGSDDMSDALAACSMLCSGLMKLKKSSLGETVTQTTVIPVIVKG